MLFRKARLYAAVPVGLAALLALGFASGGDTLVEMVVGAALPLVFGGLAAFGIWKLFRPPLGRLGRRGGDAGDLRLRR